MKLLTLGCGQVVPKGGPRHRDANAAGRSAKWLRVDALPRTHRRILGADDPPGARRSVVLYDDGSAVVVLVKRDAPRQRLSQDELGAWYHGLTRCYHGAHRFAEGRA